ncbi:MAG: outer membrane beta-barrel protein [Fluviicola sp.]|jgi:outer membrane protein W
MKRILTVISALVVIMTAGNNVHAQAASQGNVIIDPYYGFPNFGKNITKQLSEGLENVKVGGYGPAGIRVEYMLADKFGIGVDAIFNGYNVEGSGTDTTGYDGMGNPITDTYTAKYSMNRFRIQARFNYHFDVSSPNLDTYIGLGVGTNNRTYKYWEDGVEQTDDQTSVTLIPVSFRFAAGMRYYFTENIGVNAELGLGGPAISAGLSFKF